MRTSPSTVPPVRLAIGSILLLGGLLVASACGVTESARGPTTRTLQLTAYDSTSGTPLDSAQAVNRTFGDTMRTDSAGAFIMRNVEPALYIFDISGYGFHPQRHVSVLVEPEDTTIRASTPLLPKQLHLSCEGSRPFNWDSLVSQYREDSTRVRVRLIDVFARNGQVQIQPVVVNDLPTTTLFIPDNFGKLGHFDVQLYDGNNNRIPYRYENAPPDEGHRIYSKGDIIPVVPQDAQRLQQSTLVVGDSIASGKTLYARMEYTFSNDDTLRATSVTTFPDLDLDSLQVPVFDTVRTDGRVLAEDSLVIQRDTTVMRIAGIDTTVTRSGYLLFSTLRESNAAPSPRAARTLLYVPDSVKARARRDSLEALAEADSTVPPIDTSAVTDPSSTFRIVDRTDQDRLDSLLTDDELASSLSNGLPNLDMTADSLLSMSPTLRDAFLQSPVLSRSRTRVGYDTEPDSTFQDSVLLSAPLSDSLFHLVAPDSLSLPDTTVETPRNPFTAAGSMESLQPETDSLPVDSLRLTVSPDADSVVESTVITEDLQSPPSHTYWYVPDSLSSWRTTVMVVDPSFYRLRARARIDTSATIDIESLLPARVGTRDRIITRSYPQQVLRMPAGTYRDTYLQVWRKLQAANLKNHYCQIFPFPLRSEWRSTSMH